MQFSYHGIFLFDLSTYQDSPLIPGHINFEKMRDYGASAVGIKASQGNYADPDFSLNWQNSKGILPRFSYHYYDNTFSPNVQAQTYWNTIKNDPEGICFFDLEDRDAGDYFHWRHWYDCLIRFQSLSQLPDDRIGIYTGKYYFEEFLATASFESKKWFGRFPLWLAAYTPDPFHPNYEAIRIPFDTLVWTECLMLQSGTPAIGIEAGVESQEIDYNHFNGDQAKFEQIFGISPAPIPPDPPIGVIMQYKVIWTDGVTKRSAPTTSAAGGIIIPLNTIVDVVEDNIPDQTYPTDTGKKWAKFTDGKYGATIYNNAPRMEKISEPIPIPPAGDLPVLHVTITGDGYQTVNVDIHPTA